MSISFLKDSEGYIYLRKNSQVLVPILLFNEIGKDGNFNKNFRYEWEIHDVLTLAHSNPKPVKIDKNTSSFLKNIFNLLNQGADKIVTSFCARS